jgi:uncharacterized protein with PIN domain
MDIYTIPFLPFPIWAIATGLSLILVMLACGMYLYYHKRFRNAIKDYEDVEDLAAKKVQLEAEVEQCKKWLDSNREELLRLDVERQEQERVRQDLANLENKAAQKQQEVDDFRKETNDLQNVVTVLSQDRDRLVEEIKSLEDEKQDFEKATQDMRGVIERYKEEKEKLDDLLQSIVQNEIKQQSLIAEISAREARHKQVQNELEQAQEKLSKIKADTVPIEELNAEKERVRKDRDELIEEIEKHKGIKDRTQKEYEELEEKKGNLKHEVDVLNRKIIDLREESGIDIDKADRYIDLLAKPDCLYGDYFPRGESGPVEELEKINYLKNCLTAQGLIFPERILKAFHTSLKTNSISPLTVLAGISGTGKTLLPIKYAEAMGMHSLVVSIQPRWDSPQDLFGFYNYLERKYKATELARALVRMDPYKFNDLEGGNRSDRMLLVLLDEMNLARVEYYFSEFLSKLELRRGIGDELNATERNRAEIEMETGPRDEKNMNFRLWVGENVLFVGTVNEDESTQTLSDKVLDRANVLRFGKPSDDLNQVFNHEVTPQEQYLHLTEWKEWIKELPGNNDWDDNVDKWIKSINASLERIGRPFGHRVQLAMRLYVKNYPGVTVGDTHKYAFADQIEQKVIPKLRGIDLNEGRSQECLDEILNLVEELGDTDLETAFKDSKEDLSTGMFTWRGVTRSAEV